MHFSPTQRAPRRLAFAFVIGLYSTCAALQTNDLPQRSSGSPARYEFRQAHDPDGIGKFYMGREIAQVMGHQGAEWLERAERGAEEAPDVLLTQLKIHPGATVADIGAGTGYLTRRLARQVGPAGRVFAVDIQPEMLAILTNSAARVGLTNIIPVLGTDTDPRLAAASVDMVLMVDVYHEFEFPYEMMMAICRSLKTGARVAFVEYREEDATVPIKPLHKMAEAQVRKEMSVLPLVWVETLEPLPRQHLIIFRKQPESAFLESAGSKRPESRQPPTVE